MAIDGNQFVRVSHRVRNAIGYMELGMTQRALDHLEGIGQLGPFEAAVDLLRGEAYRILRRWDDATESFESAARKFKDPHDRSAWFALSQCLREAGDVDRAIQTLAHARGAKPSAPWSPSG